MARALGRFRRIPYSVRGLLLMSLAFGLVAGDWEFALLVVIALSGLAVGQCVFKLRALSRAVQVGAGKALLFSPDADHAHLGRNETAERVTSTVLYSDLEPGQAGRADAPAPARFVPGPEVAAASQRRGVIRSPRLRGPLVTVYDRLLELIASRRHLTLVTHPVGQQLQAEDFPEIALGRWATR